MHEVHDSVSAEAYCALGGAVVPSKVAMVVGDRRGMQAYARLVSVGGRTGASVTEEKKRELLRVLMEVYTQGGYVFVILIFTEKMTSVVYATEKARQLKQHDC